MRNTLELSPCPVDESCAQLGAEDYARRARRECRAFINQLERAYPPPAGAMLFINHNRHDFGTYYEVAVAFSDADDAAAEYAFMLEANLPERWDDDARAELGAV